MKLKWQGKIDGQVGEGKRDYAVNNVSPSTAQRNVLKFQRFKKWQFLLLFSVLAVFPCLFSFISVLVCACVHCLCVTSSASAASERLKQRPDLPGGLDPPSHSCLRAARRYPIRQVSEGKRGVHQKERRKANEPRRRSPRRRGGTT